MPGSRQFGIPDPLFDDHRKDKKCDMVKFSFGVD